MPCVSQALVASEVRDGRSATQSLPLKSLPLRASWHFRHLFLLKGQTRVGYCIEGVKTNGSPKPAPWPGMCTEPECVSWDRASGLPAYPADWGIWPGGDKAAGDPSVKTDCGICWRMEVYRAEHLAGGSPACSGYFRAGAHI